MYGCESWTIKKAEQQRINAFALWCWRRLLRVPWIARSSNQSILKEINPEYSLERLMLELKLQYFGHLMGRADSLEKTLMLGKIEGRKRRRRERMRWLDSITDSMDMSLSKLVIDREAWHAAVHGVTKSRTEQQAFQTCFLHSPTCIQGPFLHAFLWLGSASLFSAESYPVVWMDHSLCIHSHAKEHLVCFQLWAIMNKAARNIQVQVFM